MFRKAELTGLLRGKSVSVTQQISMKPIVHYRKYFRVCLAATISAGLLAVLSAANGFCASPSTNTVLLFSFFRGNGEDGLFLASGQDGLKWTELKAPEKSFLKPTVGGKIMRDPCLQRGPEGKFHLVWTTSWGKPLVFGYACSQDLLRWSEPRAIPVLTDEPAARNVWAPELFYDEGQKQWLILWSTTIPGRFPETDPSGDDGYNHRFYFTVTRDFATFAPAKLFYNPGFNVIDATLLSARDKYYLIFKDETLKPVKKNLRIAAADRPDGPFSPAGAAISTNWVEGPSAIQIGKDFFIYFDHYARPQYYGALKSTDLERWEDISSQVAFPKGARHGTVLRVPEEVVLKIQNGEGGGRGNR
jgi:hypothetical protein